MVAEAETQLVTAASTSTNADTTLHIVLVNDAAELLDTLRLVLEDTGYRVTRLAEALTDVQQLAEYRPDLILLDWMFQGQPRGGLEVAQAIRLTPDIKDLPIIMCAEVLPEVQEMADYLQSQGVTMLFKPFDRDSFLTTVGRALEKNQPPRAEA